uniref:Uncharacterized protein n=1 Tax=Romanomermis culicivorax TaxID=13658 RepID=A0A915JC08_ROMCU
MAAEAEAAREARAKVIAAEGEQKASKALREAAQSDSEFQIKLMAMVPRFILQLYAKVNFRSEKTATTNSHDDELPLPVPPVIKLADPETPTPPPPSPRLIKPPRMSMGTGKMMVELCSAAMLFNACKCRNWMATGDWEITSAASFSARLAFISPSAATTLALASRAASASAAMARRRLCQQFRTVYSVVDVINCGYGIGRPEK